MLQYLVGRMVTLAHSLTYTHEIIHKILTIFHIVFFMTMIDYQSSFSAIYL